MWQQILYIPVIFLFNIHQCFVIQTDYNDINDFFPEVKNNFTKVTWAHAVNSKKLLENALHGPVMMLEADIVLGYLKNNNSELKRIPVMSHPPNIFSDLSLEQFISNIIEFNSKSPVGKKKGIKLDFKSIAVFEESVFIIDSLIEKINFPMWINADILPGPINSIVPPVNPERFFKTAEQFPGSTLSIGWTTRYSESVFDGNYSKDNIEDMINAINVNKVKQKITFPVRAGLAAKSVPQLQNLVDSIEGSTLTIWSSENDPVNVEDLRTLIFTIGLNKTFVDVPEDLLNLLKLDEPIKVR